MLWVSRSRLALPAVVVALALSVAPERVPGAVPPLPPEPSGLSAAELAAEPPFGDPFESESNLAPVDAAHADDVRIELFEELGYVDEGGRHRVDLLEGDYAYVTATLRTADGRPIRGAEPTFAVQGASRVVQPQEVSARTVTDDFGDIDFAILGGRMGLDRVTVSFAGHSTELFVNVISLRAAGFPEPKQVEGGLPWSELKQARIKFLDQTFVANFPPSVSARAGTIVKLSGFMMPLDPDLKQRRFLLTSNPPSCFFHLPGGPAGAVEVFASGGIEVTWDPIVVQGRFEPVTSSEAGVLYRLHEARIIDH